MKILKGAGVVVLAIVALVAGMAIVTKREQEASTRSATERARAAPPQAPSAPPPEKEKSLLEVLLEQPTLADALDVVIPLMKDTTNEESTGTIMLTRWAADRMSLADVLVPRNETSFKLVQKDSDAALGKRICLKGSLISIAKIPREGGGPIYSGLLNTGRLDVVSFLAVQSTGELVQGSRAKLCGVVTGRYSYSNAGGGTTHAVKVVGIFDIQENIEHSIVRVGYAACECPDARCKATEQDRLRTLVANASVRLPPAKRLALTSAGVAIERARACGVTLR